MNISRYTVSCHGRKKSVDLQSKSDEFESGIFLISAVAFGLCLAYHLWLRASLFLLKGLDRIMSRKANRKLQNYVLFSLPVLKYRAGPHSAVGRAPDS